MEKMKQGPIGALESRDNVQQSFLEKLYIFFFEFFWRIIMIATYGFWLRENILGRQDGENKGTVSVKDLEFGGNGDIRLYSLGIDH